eukprot:SM000006S19458  [mRNA]  locus=s6:863343:866519:- [translate_table: standard]
MRTPMMASAGLALLFLASNLIAANAAPFFQIEEATIASIQAAYKNKSLTTYHLVNLYLVRIRQLNPYLHAILEVNPDVQKLAIAADKARAKAGGFIGGMHGIPIILKDNIATADKMNNTAGSYALLGAVSKQDSTLVKLLRKAGAIILGKANLSEWANFRGTDSTNGWSGRGGFTRNPYGYFFDTCGSSSGSGSSVSASLTAVTLGSETDGSIICPSGFQSAAGIKPTVGLTSRAGVIPISHTQDTVGPICRTLTDSVTVLDVIAGGFDPLDPQTKRCVGLTPKGGYTQTLLRVTASMSSRQGCTLQKRGNLQRLVQHSKAYLPKLDYMLQFLKADGLKGKRLGVLKNYFFNASNMYLGGSSFVNPAGQKISIFTANYSGPDPAYIANANLAHLATMQKLGATIVEIGYLPYLANVTGFQDIGEQTILVYELKHDINAYLAGLKSSPIKEFSDLIKFNIAHAAQELVVENQDWFLAAQNTSFSDPKYNASLRADDFVISNGLDYVIQQYKLDAFVAPTSSPISNVAALKGYPAISIPAGYTPSGQPFGLTFMAGACTEPTLIEAAYAFEQATKLRKKPTYIDFPVKFT